MNRNKPLSDFTKGNYNLIMSTNYDGFNLGVK